MCFHWSTPQLYDPNLSGVTGQKLSSSGAKSLPGKQWSDWGVNTTIHKLQMQTGGSRDTYHRSVVDRSRGKIRCGDHAHVGDVSEQSCFNLLKASVFVIVGRVQFEITTCLL